MKTVIVDTHLTAEQIERLINGCNSVAKVFGVLRAVLDGNDSTKYAIDKMWHMYMQERFPKTA
jgi:hypothetical protein